MDRITEKINLQPFTLKEAEALLKVKNKAIDRRDHVVNLCEIKFSLSLYTITKAYAENLRNKIRAFKEETGTKKASPADAQERF